MLLGDFGLGFVICFLLYGVVLIDGVWCMVDFSWVLGSSVFGV